MEFDWKKIATKLRSIAQAGKTFAKDEYELQRHKDIEEICAHILANHTDLELDDALETLQSDFGYPTPKTDSRGVIFKDNKILLVKEIEDGGWTLPGGWCDCEHTPSENAQREVWEESGFEVKATRLLAVYDRNTQGHKPYYPFDIYKMFFLCEITGGSAKTSNETSEIKFFAEDEIDDLTFSVSRTLPKQIKLFFEMYRNPDMPTQFD